MPKNEATALVKGPITRNVGSGEKNLALDVALVQNLLNLVAKVPQANRQRFYDKKVIASVVTKLPKTQKVSVPLVVNGKCGIDTIQRIKDFQSEFCSFTPDGNIGVGKKTWNKLVQVSQININSQNKRQLILGLSSNISLLTSSKIDKARLYRTIKSHLFLDNKNEQLSTFIDLLMADTTLTNIQWAAYYLATVYHETAFSFKPPTEAGKGANKPYGKAITVTDTDGILGIKGKTYSNKFYGRGYIQITHDISYKYISEKIGLKKNELYINPDKALETDVSYKILTYWMQNDIPHIKGEGRKIQEFIQAGIKPNYTAARAIVNGTDDAELIAKYAVVCELLLVLCSR